MTLDNYCFLRVHLAKAMLTDADPRLRSAFEELRRDMLAENERELRPALLRPQI